MVDDGANKWIQVGWAEVGWKDDNQYVFVYDTQDNVWEFYEQYPISQGDSITVAISYQGGISWAAWIWWDNSWNLLGGVADIGISSPPPYTEQFGEVHLETAGEYFEIRNPYFENTHILVNENWDLWDESYSTIEYDTAPPSPYYVEWFGKYYFWAIKEEHFWCITTQDNFKACALVNVDADASPGDVVLPDDVALWHLDENSGDVILDETANNNDGTIRAHHGTLGPDYPSNCPTWTDNGKVGGALSFDGDDYVEVPDSPSLSPPSGMEELTVEFWYYSGPADEDATLFDKYTEGGSPTTYHGWFIDEQLGTDNTKFRLFMQVGTGSGYRNYWVDNVADEEEWVHIAMVWDGSELYMFVNGENITGGNYWGVGTGNVSNTTENLYIGAEDAGWYGTKGKIDEARIYDRALSAGEISTRYGGGEIDRENLVAEYRFENVENGIARDDHMWADGKYDKALRFDGVDDYVEVPDSSSLDIESQITLMAWVYPRVNPDGHKVIVSKYLYESNSGYLLKLESAAGDNFRITFALGRGGMTSYVVYDATFEARWWQVAGTYDGREQKLYVDGEFVSSAKWIDSISTNNLPLLLGAENEGLRHFDGVIDEVHISNFVNYPTSGFLITERNYHDTSLEHPSWGQISWGENLPEDTDIELYVATSDNAEVDDNTVGLWHLDENSSHKVFDSTKNCNDGEIYYAKWADGKFGTALQFSSNAWVKIPASPSLNISGTQITVEAWVYPQGFAAGTDPDWVDQVVAKGADSQDGYYGIQIRGGENNVARFYLHVGENLGPAGDNWIEGTTDLQENTWYYIAGVYDGSKMRIYVNGVLEGEKDQNMALYPTSTADLYLGRQGWGGGYEYFFDGIIDEVRISNVARSENEIQSYYEGCKAHYAWDNWTGPYTNSSGENITSASKRYVKWKAVLSSVDGLNTPILHDVTINWY